MKIEKSGDVASKRVCMLIAGRSGVGKTSLIKTLGEDDTLVISVESGLACLAGTNYDVINIDPKKIMVEIGNVFIDSVSELSDAVLAQLKSDPVFGLAKNTLMMYAKNNDLFSGIVKSFRDLEDFSVFFSCLSTSVKDGLVETENFAVNGSKIKDQIKSWFDVVLFYKIYELENGDKVRKLVSDCAENILAKDRTGLLEKYEEPNLNNIVLKIKNGVKNV